MHAPSIAGPRGPSPFEPVIEAVEGSAALDGPAAMLGMQVEDVLGALRRFGPVRIEVTAVERFGAWVDKGVNHLERFLAVTDDSRGAAA